MNEKALYTGPERREYCAQHCQLSETAKKSVPRWAFLSALGTMTVVSIAFAGWYVAGIKTLEVNLETAMAEHEIHVAQRMHDAQLRYEEDVERFIRAVGENRNVLREVGKDLGDIKVRLGNAETKQDMILQKLKMAE